MNTPTFGTGNGSIKSPCEHDLAGDASSAEWRNYCPNVDTLDALQSNQQERVPSDGTVILAEPLGGLATPIPAGGADGCGACGDYPITP